MSTGRFLKINPAKNYPVAERAEGVYIYGQGGQRWLDGCGGSIVVNIGHGVKEIGRAMAEQAAKAAFIYRMHYATERTETLADRLCAKTDGLMNRAFFVSSGSEATESAVKIARKYHLARGEAGRYKVVSRWQSYHGMTMGALSWSGHTGRRSDYQLLFKDTPHIAPAYCYRCWFGAEPGSCDLPCAQALENTILTEGPGTVAAFIAEPVVGAALGAAAPPAGYFKKIREICSKYGVVMIMDEVMTGAGRTGKFFATEHFGVAPDLIAFAKGVSGGYFPVGGVLLSAKVTEAIEQGGGFGPGHTYSAHPVGSAAALAVLDYLDKHDLVAASAAKGEILAAKLAQALADRPSVGDLRGLGLMRGVEFVKNRETKETFDPALGYAQRVYDRCLAKGLIFLPSGACDRGRAGDLALFGPPFVITEGQIEELVGVFAESVKEVEKEVGV